MKLVEATSHLRQGRKEKRSEDLAFLSSVLIQPDAGSSAAADQGPDHCALLAFYYRAGSSAASSAYAYHCSSAAGSGHPTVLVLVIQDTRSVEQGDFPLPDSDPVLIASDEASILVSTLGGRIQRHRQPKQGEDEQETS